MPSNGQSKEGQADSLQLLISAYELICFKIIFISDFQTNSINQTISWFFFSHLTELICFKTDLFKIFVFNKKLQVLKLKTIWYCQYYFQTGVLETCA